MGWHSLLSRFVDVQDSWKRGIHRHTSLALELFREGGRRCASAAALVFAKLLCLCVSGGLVELCQCGYRCHELYRSHRGHAVRHRALPNTCQCAFVPGPCEFYQQLLRRQRLVGTCVDCGPRCNWQSFVFIHVGHHMHLYGWWLGQRLWRRARSDHVEDLQECNPQRIVS